MASSSTPDLLGNANNTTVSNRFADERKHSLDSMSYLDLNDPESPLREPDHEPSEMKDTVQDPHPPSLKDYPRASLIFDLSPDGQEFRDPFTTDPREGYSVSPSISPKTRTLTQEQKDARNAIERVYAIFQDAKESDDESMIRFDGPDVVPQYHPVIYEGPHLISSQKAQISSVGHDSDDLSRQTAHRTEESTNDTNSGPPGQDFASREPERECHCHWCVQHRRRTHCVHDPSAWCYCTAYVPKKDERREAWCCGEVWGWVRGCLKDGDGDGGSCVRF
jgi:hypothetical protein